MRWVRLLHEHVVIELCARLFNLLVLPAFAPAALRLLGVTVGRGCRIYTPLTFANIRFGNLCVGDGCHIGREVFFDLADRVSIGRNVTVSMRVTCVTHLDVGRSLAGCPGFASRTGGIVIGDGAYVGACATILHGVRIGENAVVGAGALVREDVPARTVVAGVPARVVKRLDG